MRSVSLPMYFASIVTQLRGLAIAGGLAAALAAAAAPTVNTTIAAGTNPAAIAINPITNKIYVANDGSNDVTVIDGATHTTTSIPVGSRPQWIAANPETNKIYVSNAATPSISIISGATHTISTTLHVGDVGWTTINPVTNKAYVIRYGFGDEVSIIHDETYPNTAATRSYQPVGIAINPVTNVLYIPHSATADVVAIDVSVDALYPTLLCPNGTGGFKPSPGPSDPDPGPCINVPDKPVAVTVNPVTNRIYALSSSPTQQISVINGVGQPNPHTFTSLTPAGVSGGKAIAVNPVTNRIYVAFANHVVVVNGADNAMTVIPSSGPVAIGINAFTNKIYVPNANGTLTVIDGDTNAASTLAIPAGARAIAVNPVTNTMYVLTADGVTPIDGSSDDTVHAVPLTTAIAPLPGDSSGPDGSVSLDVSSTFSLASLATARKVYYQLDSTDGSWTTATGSGPFTAAFTGLAPGTHTLFAFAANGLDAPSIMTDMQNNPIVGNVASYTFTVTGGTPVDPSISVASSVNPSSAGQGVTFTATVSSSAGTATGTVEFRDGATSIASCAAVTLSSGGAACTTSSLSVGSHSVTARYSGNASYNPAISGTINQVVNLATASAGLTSSANPSNSGQSVTFTATVTGSAGPPTGTMDFRDGATSIAACSAVPLSGGSASCATASLSAGGHSITARYSGNGSYNAGTSSPLAQTVNAAAKPNASILLTSSANPAVAGQSVTFTASLSGSAGTPSGTVDFRDGAASIAGCASAVVSGGVATCSTASLSPGSHTVTAQYSGSASYNPGSSSALDQAVQDAPPPSQTVASLSASALDFDGHSMGTTSPPARVTITNTGASSLAIGSVSISDSQFAQSNDCSSLSPGASCMIVVTFSPVSTSGPLNSTVSVSGTLTITSNAAGSPHTVSLAGTAEKSLVAHYYRSILRREPDAAGKAHWQGESTRLASLGANVNEAWYALASAFHSSPEYAAFGSDDSTFLSDLYDTFFNRTADGPGHSWWSRQLAAGMPREAVLASFMFSPESANFTQGIFGNTSARAEANTVMDFYRGLLSRLPDSAGYDFYLRRFRQAQCRGTEDVYIEVESISSGFVGSAEYSGRNRTNAQYVADLYNAFLRRGADLEGFRFWVNELDTGTRSRGRVRQDFKSSPEFTHRVSAMISEGCAA